MRAGDLTPGHLGWEVEAKWAKGTLKVVAPITGTQMMEILVQAQDGGYQGVNVHRDDEIFAEKTLEMQVKDDLAGLKQGALRWIKGKVR